MNDISKKISGGQKTSIKPAGLWGRYEFKFISALVIMTMAMITISCGQFPSTTKVLQAQSIGEPISWTHLSTANGDLDPPSASQQQTSALVLDIDKDGLNDLVVGTRRDPGPSMVWYKRLNLGWQRFVIDDQVLNVEAGGAYHDIDGDGDLDIVMGGDASTNEVWWWENPYPSFDPAKTWTRRLIKNSGATKHHDQMFGDFDNDGRVELVFWNQNNRALYLAEIPDNPLLSGPWSLNAVYFWSNGSEHEGLAQADIDLDGLVDIVGGGRWFKYNGDGTFTAHVIDAGMAFTRAAAGQLIEGGRPEVVFVVGDGTSRLQLYEWDGSSWNGRDLLGFDVDHGHTLRIADINGDGKLDIFVAEMRLDGGNGDAKSWVLLGDGTGNFTTMEVSNGFGNHESRVADLDGDGDLDIFGKPYNWETPRLDIWLNEGGNTCQPSLNSWERHVIDPAKPERSLFIFPADLDGDGFEDIVTGGWWYKNPGEASGTWARRTIGAPLNNAAAVYDFDGDGDLDILGTEGIGSQVNAAFVWARNDGGGNFTIFGNIDQAEGDFLQGTAVDRFTPGETDVALSWHQAGFGVQALRVPADPENGRWTWRRLSAVSQDEALSSGDIDRDGDPDLLLGTKWLRNDRESGTWTAFDLFSGGGSPDRNRLVDMNNDGRLDAVVGYEAVSSPGDLVWYEQPPVATSQWIEHHIATITGPMSLDVMDMDGDGDLDIVAGEHDLNNGGNQARILVFENPGSQGGGWIEHLIHTGDEHHDGAQLLDVDNDGDLDVISIGWDHNRVLLYENTACSGSNPPPGPTATPVPTSTPTATQGATVEPTATETLVPGVTAEPTATETLMPGVTATPSPTAVVPPTPPPGECAPDPQNMLTNPGFEQGGIGWVLYTEDVKSHFSTSADNSECGMAALLAFEEPSSNMQFYQTGFTLQPNSAYILSFDAYSESGHDLSLVVHRHSEPYTNYGLSEDNVDLGTSWRHFVFHFTTGSEVTDPRLRFWFRGHASAGDVYWLDNVRLVPADPTTIIPGGCAPNPQNVLNNPRFEEGASGWSLYTEDAPSNYQVAAPPVGCGLAARLAFAGTSSNMQFYQTGFTLQPNTAYTLSFAAYSESGHDLSLWVHKHGEPYTNYGPSQATVDLGTSWQHFVVHFTTGSEVTDPRLRFWFRGYATAGDVYWLDNVRVVPADPTPIIPGGCAPDPQNVLNNPLFEEGGSGWSLYTEDVPSNYQVAVPPVGCGLAARLAFAGTSSNMQFYQTGFMLQPNTAYILSFAAYSDSGHDLSLRVHRHSEPYTNYGLREDNVDLGTSWRHFVFHFTTGSEVTNPRLKFWFGGYASTGDVYWLDNVHLVPIETGPGP